MDEKARMIGHSVYLSLSPGFYESAIFFFVRCLRLNRNAVISLHRITNLYFGGCPPGGLPANGRAGS